MPAFLPQRITPELVAVLRKHRVWLSLHFSNAAELTPEVAEACDRLADAGIPLGSQTVLLRGINDAVPALKALFHGLLKLRVRPYYLYQCDPVVGTSHLRTTVAKGLELIAGLRGHTCGYAVPTYVIDAPGGGGKVPAPPPDHRVVRARHGDAAQLGGWRVHLPRPGGSVRSHRMPDHRVHRPNDGRKCEGVGVRVGLTYDLRDDYLALGFSREETAEFDRAETIDAIADALSAPRARRASASATPAP